MGIQYKWGQVYHAGRGQALCAICELPVSAQRYPKTTRGQVTVTTLWGKRTGCYLPTRSIKRSARARRSARVPIVSCSQAASVTPALRRFTTSLTGAGRWEASTSRTKSRQRPNAWRGHSGAEGPRQPGGLELKRAKCEPDPIFLARRCGQQKGKSSACYRQTRANC